MPEFDGAISDGLSEPSQRTLPRGRRLTKFGWLISENPTRENRRTFGQHSCEVHLDCLAMDFLL
jgi:hypothetical protein